MSLVLTEDRIMGPSGLDYFIAAVFLMILLLVIAMAM
jgi:hypothetical protein